nr:AtpZ/AtpI family protein [Paraburkholderia graminis]
MATSCARGASDPSLPAAARRRRRQPVNRRGYIAAMNEPRRVERPSSEDRLAAAAQEAARRAVRAREVPEPSLGSRLGQIGILGWAIVLPTLLGLALGRWLDRIFATRVFFSAPLLMAGAALGFWSAWKWMHRQQGERRD